MNFQLALGAVAMAVSGLANAAAYDWTLWSTSAPPAGVTATGTAGSTGISYSGIGSYNGDVPLWSSNPKSWQGGVVGTLPSDADGVIHLIGGGGGDAPVNTLTFSQAVTNPVFAIWSLGQGGAAAEFDFQQQPTFVVGGPNTPYGGGPVTVSGNNVSGLEGNGTIEFIGTFTSISWTNPKSEDWYGFTVGVSAVPEPGTVGLLLGGLVLIGLARRRQTK
jgi:hypothetical protein